MLNENFQQDQRPSGRKFGKNAFKSTKIQDLKQNYKNYCGEIDIIAKDGGTIVFVEVKSRESAVFGRPSEAVDRTKHNKMRKAALVYLNSNKLSEAAVRFDVIEILGGEINHIKNAF